MSDRPSWVLFYTEVSYSISHSTECEDGADDFLPHLNDVVVEVASTSGATKFPTKFYTPHFLLRFFVRDKREWSEIKATLIVSRLDSQPRKLNWVMRNNN